MVSDGRPSCNYARTLGEELINDYLLLATGPGPRSDIARHLADCGSCQEYVADLNFGVDTKPSRLKDSAATKTQETGPAQKSYLEIFREYIRSVVDGWGPVFKRVRDEMFKD